MSFGILLTPTTTTTPPFCRLIYFKLWAASQCFVIILWLSIGFSDESCQFFPFINFHISSRYNIVRCVWVVHYVNIVPIFSPSNPPPSSSSSSPPPALPGLLYPSPSLGIVDGMCHYDVVSYMNTKIKKKKRFMRKSTAHNLDVQRFKSVVKFSTPQITAIRTG